MLALAIVALASAVYAADENPTWGKWNVAPYATSLKEALQKAHAAIDSFKWEPQVKAHFDSVLADPRVLALADTVWLTPDLPLEQMMSGGVHPHVMNNRPVGELPVLRSPDGRLYRKGAVAETAKALSWSWEFEGETYVLCLPLVCFNWCWFFSTSSAPEQCVTLSFNAPVGGKVRWGIATIDEPFPPSACNAQRQGIEGKWTAWEGQCDNCVRSEAALKFMRTILGDNAEIFHMYLYPVTAENQTLRFSAAIRSAVVYVCVEDKSGKRSYGVYMRPQDWKGQYEMFIEDRLWKWVVEEK